MPPYSWWQMSETTARNIRALEQAAKADRARASEIYDQLKLAQQAILSLSIELTTLRVQVVTMIAKLNGTGKTT